MLQRVVAGLIPAAAVLAAALAIPAAGAAAGASAADVDGRYERVRDAYLALRKDTEAQRYRHNYLRVVEGFERFVSDHPQHRRAPDALYNAGRLAWDLYLVSRVPGDLERSRSLFRRLADTWPDDHLADDAQFLIGRILLEHGGDKGEAWRSFAEVVRRFPQGDMAPRAKEMLTRLAAWRPEEPAPEPERPAVVARTTTWRGSPGEKTARVTEVKTWSNDDFTRIVAYLTGPVTWREGEVPADEDRGLPRRIYVDLKKADLAPEAAEPVPVGDGLLLQVRTGQFSPEVVRVVLDVASVDHAKVFPLEAPHRLVIDVTGENHEAARPAVASAEDLPNLEHVREVLSESPEIPLSVQAGLKIRRVIVDAGHGGHDSGAVGKGGLKEKVVALDIALKVGRKLEAAGYEVVYTRTDDTFVPLEERTAIANTRGGDLFVSIHANAHPRRDRKGVSTYYLDVTNDRYAIRLAAQENATSEKSVSDLQFILADLAKRSNVDDSVRLATRIQEHTVGRLREGWGAVKDLGVRYALFYVLLGAKMPSVLVETSFISNPAEEHRLGSEVYRAAVAEGVFRGIERFVADRNAVAMGE